MDSPGLRRGARCAGRRLRLFDAGTDSRQRFGPLPDREPRSGDRPAAAGADRAPLRRRRGRPGDSRQIIAGLRRTRRTRHHRRADVQRAGLRRPSLCHARRRHDRQRDRPDPRRHRRGAPGRPLPRDRIYVAAVGDITAAELGPLLDTLLGDLPATGGPPAGPGAVAAGRRRDGRRLSPRRSRWCCSASRASPATIRISSPPSS